MAQLPSRMVIWEETPVPGESVVHVRGELDLDNAHRLAASISRAARGGAAKLLVDLMDCNFIDSTGLVVILRGSRKLEAAGGTLSVACGHPEVRRLFALTAIDQSVLVLDALPQGNRV